MEKISYRFDEINIREIEESPLNAQVLEGKEFDRLVNSIKKDGCLTSSILIMEQPDKKYMCISGHHRIKASKKAGLKKVPCLIIPEIDESTRIRLQLSHNDIHGTSDELLLSTLMQKLNESDIELVKVINNEVKEKIKEELNKDIKIDVPKYRYVNLCLLEQNKDDLEQMIESLNSDETTSNYLLTKDEFKDVYEILTLAYRKGYKSPGHAFKRFIEIVKENNELI